MISEGFIDIAIAIATRCFIPPLSSCGNLVDTSAGRPTLARRFATVLLNSVFARRTWWSFSPSIIWSRIRITGFSELSAPCGTIATSESRLNRVVSSSSSSKSEPLRRIFPASIFAGGL